MPNIASSVVTCSAFVFAASLCASASPAATPVATPTACPTFASGVTAFGIDQAQPIVVEQSQSFVLAMRGGGGESFLLPYRMRVAPSGPVVTFVRPFTVNDAAYANADRKPGEPYVADGPSTQYFLFTTHDEGTATVTFDEFAVGKETTPYASKTFTVVVKRATLIC